MIITATVDLFSVISLLVLSTVNLSDISKFLCVKTARCACDRYVNGSIGLVYGQRMYCACVRGAGVRCSNARQLPGDQNVTRGLCYCTLRVRARQKMGGNASESWGGFGKTLLSCCEVVKTFSKLVQISSVLFFLIILM